MFTTVKAKMTQFFRPSTLQDTIKQRKADEALKFITDANIPINTFYGNFTILGLSTIWRCDKLTLELVKRNADPRLGKTNRSGALQAAVSATGEDEDLASAILFVAHGTHLTGINFVNNPGYKKLLESVAKKYVQQEKIKKLYISGSEHDLQKQGADLCAQLAKYWQDIAELVQTRPIYQEYCLTKAKEYIAKAQQSKTSLSRNQSSEVFEEGQEHIPLLGIKQRSGLH